MSDIVAFIRARLDEDEQIAVAASTGSNGATPTGEHWQWECGDDDTHLDITPVTVLDEHLVCPNCDGFKCSLRSVEEYPSSVGPLPNFVIPHCEEQPTSTAHHITHHDPARVLREVEAKRALLQLHRPIKATDVPGLVTCSAENVRINDCPTLGALAYAWADHQDFAAEWLKLDRRPRRRPARTAAVRP